MHLYRKTYDRPTRRMAPLNCCCQSDSPAEHLNMRFSEILWRILVTNSGLVSMG